MKSEIKLKEEKLLELTNAFCSQKLNEEYAQLCEKLIKKMGRKREVPFARGKLEIWAAAVINAIGTVNFLFDKSTSPFTSVKEINEFFGTNSSTVGQKASLIRDMFKMGYFDNEFSTKSMSENDPFKDLVMVDGFIVPISHLPEEYQKMVREARSRGEDISFETNK